MGAQTAQAKITTDASNADDCLSLLCNKYGVKKPFSLSTSGASSPLTGL
jgi:hypothetical protein